MGNFLNLTGHKYNNLTVIKMANTRSKKNHIKWICRCDCGEIIEVERGNLRSGLTKSCGCTRAENLIGKKFGKLTAIKLIRLKDKKNKWLCICDCGKSVKVRTDQLKRGIVRSCGCLFYETVRNQDRKEAILLTLYNSLKRRSKIKNWNSWLHFDDFKILVFKPCYYCGKEYSNIYKDTCTELFIECNGLDRINNNQGYILNNVVPCCKYCNAAKNDQSKEDFLKQVSNINKIHNLPNHIFKEPLPNGTTLF